MKTASLLIPRLRQGVPRLARRSLVALAISTLPAGAAFDPARYNVAWTQPGDGPQDSMPLGNGDLTVNAWTGIDGTLSLLIGMSDSWDQNGRLLKIGGLHLRPGRCPDLTVPGNFEQTLHLEDATLRVRLGSGPDAIRIRLWVDAHRPVIHAVLESSQPLTAAAELALWRNAASALPSIETSDIWQGHPSPPPTVVPADTLLPAAPGRIGWYHASLRPEAAAMTLKHQGLTYDPARDPLRNRVFGALVAHPSGVPAGDRSLAAPMDTHHAFLIHVHSARPSSPEQWRTAAIAEAETTISRDETAAAAAHRAHWRDFWQKSWIEVTATGRLPLVPRNDLPFRFGQDAQGGNRFPGACARASLRAGGSSDAWIATRAAAAPDADDAPAEEPPLWSATQPQPMVIPDSAGWNLAEGLSAEGWFRIDGPVSARLFDRITPNGSDGFLLDLQHGRPRLILGSNILNAPEPMVAGEWTHVAAVVGQDGTRLFVNGKAVASVGPQTTDEAFLVSQAYQLQRFLTACAGKGRYPIHFNGSTFTIPHAGKPGAADYRRWGSGFWWQNTRLAYIALPASGDHDLMPSLFRMYVEDILPVSLERTRLYSGLPGAFLPECVYPWGAVFSETYGWKPFAERGPDFPERIQSSGWHKWEWTCAPELLWMMLDHYEHTLDETFLRETLVPTARPLLTFFDARFGNGADGKMLMEPSMALETWWDTTNPAPDIAGLTAVTRRLLALVPDPANPADTALWRRLLERMPRLPVRETPDGPALAPAERYRGHNNIENPELYAVFPFRLITAASPEAEKTLALNALKHRWHRGHSGWRQDDLFMAYLGLAEESRAALVQRAAARDPGQRFPAFWAPNYDWTPDQTHGGVLMKALQAMVLQTDGKAIRLLPAWPDDWQVSFRLHAPYRTVVEGLRGQDGELHWNVTPPARGDDVVTAATGNE